MKVSPVTYDPVTSNGQVAYERSYKTSVTLTADEDHIFNDKIKVTVNGKDAVVKKKDDGTLTVTYEFPATTKKIEPVAPSTPTTVEDASKKNSVALLSKSSVTWNKKNQLMVTWGRVKDADGYDLYVRQCDEKLIKKSLAYTADNNTTTSILLKKLNGKKFNGKMNYKYQVYAYKMVDGKKTCIGNTLPCHFVGQNNKKNTNPKSVSVNAGKITLKAGKSAKIKADVKKEEPKKTIMLHAALVRFVSSNEAFATVDKNGKGTAKAAGTCKIYCVLLNGKNAAVKVTVK
ncbi:MAG: Ig-like domain-containing protein [Eubacteriales bacterium]|nr:Ig-like domain-containing protein [Eubacteriales bacterium]